MSTTLAAERDPLTRGVRKNLLRWGGRAWASPVVSPLQLASLDQVAAWWLRPLKPSYGQEKLHCCLSV